MRERIEIALGKWGRIVAEHPIWVIAAVLLFTAALGTQLPNFRLDTSNEGYFHEDDPIRLQNDAFRALFGRDTIIGVALRPEGEIFELGFLERLRALHEEIEAEVPYVVDVTSLLNVRETIGNEDGMEVRDLLEDWPEKRRRVASDRNPRAANPLYENFLLSSDGRTTLIAIETEAYTVTDDVDSLEGFDMDEAVDDAPQERQAASGEQT